MSRHCVKYALRFSQMTVLALLCGFGSNTFADRPTTEHEPSSFMKHYRRAMRLVATDNWEDAIEEFQAAYDSRTTPRPEIHLYIAKVYTKLGTGAEAMKYYRRFLAEGKNMTESQRQELQEGMREAESLIEVQARLREQRAREAGRSEVRVSMSNLPRGSAEAESRSPEPQAAKTLPTPATPESSEKSSYKVVVVGRKRTMPYTVNIGDSENLCTTPCELRTTGGPTPVTVNGPGSKQFQKEVVLPNSPSRMEVQHFTLSRAIAGPILFTLGAGMLGGGVAFLTGDGARSGGIIASPFMLVHGAVFFFVGLGQMAAIKRNSINVQPIGGTLADRGKLPRLAGLDLTPTADRKGILAQATLRF